MPDYNSTSAIREYLRGRGLGIRKQWGQNFLINPSARRALAEKLGAEPGQGVWEIGSGMGAMTRELLDRGLRVKAFEVDPGLCSILTDLFAPSPAFVLIRGNVLDTWKDLEDPSPYLLGNLPYNIAAPLLGRFIEGGRFFTRMIVTVQKEVALRMAADPGSPYYSSISALCASAYTVKIFMTLRGPSFFPVPRVDSAAVCFELKPRPPNPPALLYPLIRGLFAFRRKTIANNLAHFLANSGILKGNRGRDILKTALDQGGLGGGERAEQLGLKEFTALAAALERILGSPDPVNVE
ncbi:MAG: 16S rRNA (adenine(1518)-N(6)/adenine(1519)-N(6))-dimethyltransferase RsmA [Spirochaetaceae bacterium]|jgi:16S rRNA (adenine1518-N6/adenine1519-N6)-dimethyltransferase|nr:16S rRNA (adenine(1518)-N(6)/adenine(1519)-N(6))-dimethyltransferase RsmA [Spirochaetaceae bacterium]